MSDTRRPISVNRPRTLGDVRSSQKPGEHPDMTRLRQETQGVPTYDAATGAPMQTPSLDQMSVLLKQKQDLAKRNLLDGAAAPAPVPLDIVAMQQKYPNSNIKERVAVPDTSAELDEFINGKPKAKETALGLARRRGIDLEKMMTAVPHDPADGYKKPVWSDEPEDAAVMDRIKNPHKYPGQPIPVRTRIPRPKNVPIDMPIEQFNERSAQIFKDATEKYNKENADDESVVEYESRKKPAPSDDKAALEAIRARQRQAARLPAKDETAPQDKSGAVYSGKPRFILKEVPRDNKYERINLLSGFNCYEFKECFIRRFNLPDQIKITKARETKNLSLLIDVLCGTVANGVDVRDFCMPDFRFVLYWHRWNSYSTVPFNINWQSKYGNRQTFRITETTIDMTPPPLSEENYVEWREKGFTLPTVRDYEVFETEELDEDERVLLALAQWFKGEPNDAGVIDIQQKIDYMNRLCDDNLGKLAERKVFEDAQIWGITERVELTDTKFNPVEWVAFRNEQAQILRIQAEDYKNDMTYYVALINNIEDLEDETAKLQNTLDKGGKVSADTETVDLKIAPLDFFPNL